MITCTAGVLGEEAVTAMEAATVTCFLFWDEGALTGTGALGSYPCYTLGRVNVISSSGD